MQVEIPPNVARGILSEIEVGLFGDGYPRRAVRIS